MTVRSSLQFRPSSVFTRIIQVIVAISETDSTEMSALCCNSDLTQNFRSRTSKFIRNSLGFTTPEENAAQEPPESNPLITSFGIVGEALKTSYTRGRSCLLSGCEKRLTARQEQREYLLEQVEFFLEMSVVEQKTALETSLPTVEQYIKRRMGSGGCGVCFALTE